jgi:hypothetical protein
MLRAVNVSHTVKYIVLKQLDFFAHGVVAVKTCERIGGEESFSLPTPCMVSSRPAYRRLKSYGRWHCSGRKIATVAGKE